MLAGTGFQINWNNTPTYLEHYSNLSGTNHITKNNATKAKRGDAKGDARGSGSIIRHLQ